MATLNLTTTEDTHAASGANDAGKRPALGLVSSAAVLSPGSHGSGDEYSAAARFTGVTIANAATITSATFSMRANATYASGGVISFIVCCQNADNAGALATSGATDLDGATRAGTTADSGEWVQSSITGGTRYSVSITSAVQEVINRAGWASGNAIVVLVDTHANTTLGEWQDYDANSATLGPRLDIVYGAAGSAAGQASSLTMMGVQ